jgi:hypothetical protein
MSNYRVSIKENKEDKFTIFFECEADDEDHAEEQALNAYPNGEIVLTIYYDEPRDDPDAWSGGFAKNH